MEEMCVCVVLLHPCVCVCAAVWPDDRLQACKHVKTSDIPSHLRYLSAPPSRNVQPLHPPASSQGGQLLSTSVEAQVAVRRRNLKASCQQSQSRSKFSVFGWTRCRAKRLYKLLGSCRFCFQLFSFSVCRFASAHKQRDSVPSTSQSVCNYSLITSQLHYVPKGVSKTKIRIDSFIWQLVASFLFLQTWMKVN